MRFRWTVSLSLWSWALVFLPLQTNCNVICGPDYTAETKRSMAQINEKETSFELVEALLKYIETLQVAGAVLIFLPGWNLIYSMQRHLETNPHFGAYKIIKSQTPPVGVTPTWLQPQTQRHRAPCCPRNIKYLNVKAETTTTDNSLIEIMRIIEKSKLQQYGFVNGVL